MQVEARIKLSKRFVAGLSEVTFGRYKMKIIPAEHGQLGEAVLSFDDRFKDQKSGASHPEGESDILCRLLALVLEARVTRGGMRASAVDIADVDQRAAYPQFLGECDPTTLEKDIRLFQSLGEDLARQFARACHCYSFAMEFIPADPTFAFFLLVVAVECLSNQDAVISSKEIDLKKRCERYCHFVSTYLPDQCKGDDERNQELFTTLLKTAYYSHRSAFVHGGKEVSSAALMADRVKSSYFKHATEGKEIKTPGLGWFASMIRNSLLGFLRAQPEDAEVDEDLLSRLAVEKAVLMLKAAKAIQKDQAVGADDIEYR